MLCHTLNTAPGTAASGMDAKCMVASEVARARVLHAHLDGQGAHLRLRQAKGAADPVAERITAHVVQHDDHDDQPATVMSFAAFADTTA